MEHNANTSIEFPNQKIVGRNMEKEVKTSFIEYSMSVITSRALPDARDGMKPGQRRILYAMHEDHLTYDKPFRKSATTVGNVLGRYHPHGDAAVYQTMVRMAQSFSLRYPLVEGHGNFGNVDGDGAAAYRYTEARLARLSEEMMSDIEKDVVDMLPNFDNSRKEPSVLPSRFPNILVNGSVGIAVGMATNIPPHNMVEVIDGTIYRMENPDCSIADLMKLIKGPDFPTAGIIYGSRGMYEAYTTGKGRVIVRARANIEYEHRRIVFTEIPYQVNKSMLVESMADLVKEKKIDGITDIRDESGRAGMRIVVEYRRDANAEVILNQLYKFTQLQETCAVNIIALVDGEPRLLSLADLLDVYISHQENVVTRRVKFDLEKAMREMHLYEGYKIAIDHIDEIIAIIRASQSIPEAKENLMKNFELSDAQAQAIVEMTLGRLSGMERKKIEERLQKLEEQVTSLRAILADEGKIKDIIRDEMLEIRQRFGDERRTELIEAADDIDIEDLIENVPCMITMSHAGYIKRQAVSTYSAQRRGGKGIIGMTTKDEDFVDTALVANTHDFIMMFTNHGKVHTKKAYRIPEASRTAKGSNIVNILELAENERVTAVIPVTSFEDGRYLTMVTRRGVIKRTLLSEYEYQRRGGKIALTLDEGDELLFVRLTNGNSDLLLATRNGYAVRFSEDNVRCMGRLARGVRGITVEKNDAVVGVTLVEEGKQLLTITEKGFGKRSEFDDFRAMKNRGGHGVICQQTTDKTGGLASIAAVSEDEDVILMTDEGTVIRTAAADIRPCSRTAKGVIIMRLAEGNSVRAFMCVDKEEDREEENAEVVDGAAVEAVQENTEVQAENTTEHSENVQS